MNHSRVIVRVPATSANLGPGFDVAGVALSLYNSFEFELLPHGLSFEGCPECFANDSNLVYRAFVEGAQAVGLTWSGLRICHHCDVPFTRGLGSSATCIVAGLAAAMALAGQPLDKSRLVDWATRIEGHPDNVAPAVWGGWRVSAVQDGHVMSLPLQVAHDYAFVALVPPFALSTEQARQVLPASYTREQTVTNLSHWALLMAALQNGQDALLRYALQDVLHQPYRAALINGYDAIVAGLNDDPQVVGTYLSGAGPTIMALCVKEQLNISAWQTRLGHLIHDWQLLPLSVDTTGTHLL